LSTATVIQEEREAGRAAAADTRGARHARQSVSRFVEGKARYIADIRAEGCLEAAFARSPVARGEIVEVDLSPALAPNGPAVAGLTGRDAVARTAPMPCSWHIASHASYDYWCLPHEQVLYAGDPVAAVAAATAHEAQHAASLVAVTISELPAVTDVAQAADGNILLRPETGTNVLYEAAAHGAASTGEAYPVAAAAEPTESHISRLRALPEARMARGRFRTARVTAVPMEPRGCLAEVTGGQLRLYSSTQIPVMLKRVLVEVLGLPESRVEVIAPDIGGGFGIKIAVAREEIAVCLLALQTGRPVRWIEDTIEHLTNAPHGRDEVNDVAIAYSPAGKILGMHVDCLSDVGAYSVSPLSSAIEAAAVPVRLPSVYELGDYSYRSRAVATNKPPLGTYRGVAAPVGVFIVERLLQDIAADTGVDFADIQRQNFLPEGVPTRNAAGVPYDPGRYRTAFELMISKLGYAGLRAEQSRLREAGARELIGIGMSALVEPSAVSMDGLGLRVVTDWEDAFVRLNPDCTAEVRISATSSGQAHETTFAQIAAEVLHIDRTRVRVRSNGTDDAMYGSGSWGSRVTVVAGGAVTLAARSIAAKLCAIAANRLGVTPDDVQITDGGVATVDGRLVDLAELCDIAYFRMSDLPDEMPPGLAEFSTYRPAKGFTSPYGFHGCAVAIDTLTGELRIDKYVVVSDVGRVITPELLAEQVRGGVAQGLGEALFEEISYDTSGRQATRSLFDYRMPRALDMPHVEVHHLETPATSNILGVRGAGEDGAIGAPAAVATAITDALLPVGFRANALPIRFADLIEAGAAWRARAGLGAGAR
jgi:aerobic carbon-monoxide dehydrogenase large subunit